MKTQNKELKDKHRELEESKSVADDENEALKGNIQEMEDELRRRGEENQNLIEYLTRMRNLSQELELVCNSAARIVPLISSTENTNVSNIEPMDMDAAEITENGEHQEEPIAGAAEIGQPDGTNREETTQTTSHNTVNRRERTSVTVNKKKITVI